jgi:hypothetical protein
MPGEESSEKLDKERYPSPTSRGLAWRYDSIPVKNTLLILKGRQLDGINLDRLANTRISRAGRPNS